MSRCIAKFLLVALVTITFFGCAVAAPAPTETVCTDKFVEKGNSKIYYTDAISLDDVDSLIEYFDFDNYFNRKRRMKFDKPESSKYSISIVVNEYEFQSETDLLFYQDEANTIAIEVLYPNKITVCLCREEFVPIKIIESRIGLEPFIDTNESRR